MGSSEMHHARATFSTAAIAAIAGMGLLIICLSAFLMVSIIQKRREHNRHMAALDEREFAIAQTQKEVKRRSVTRPKTLIKRDMILPFNSNSGWGNLSSVETIRPPEPLSVPPHYAPPKPVGFVPKPKRLSWPILGRRKSESKFRLKRIRVSVLSTVLESPKPSPLNPVIGGPQGGPSSPTKSRSNTSSYQSLLEQHPCFRNQPLKEETQDGTETTKAPPKSPTSNVSPTMQATMRPIRSHSVIETTTHTRLEGTTNLTRPKIHARSVSTSSQASGNPPVGGLPIPPLEIARIKAAASRQARARSILNRSPSQLSNSSYESGNSYILAVQSSPIMQSSNALVQKVAKRNFRNSMVVGPRPFRDTLTLHGKNTPSQVPIKSSVARFSSATPATQADSQAEKRTSQLTTSSSLRSLANKVVIAETTSINGIASPTDSPITTRRMTTPKRRSGSYVTPYGSPEDRRKRSSLVHKMSYNQEGPKRQLSQASTQASSTRSSNGNAFQYDPAPMSAGKPSALKGSPSARKPGHRRSNPVRLSLIPTILGPPRSRSPSPAIHDIAEEPISMDFGGANKNGLGFSSMGSLPRPPSVPVFAPELNFATTSFNATLSANSSPLPMANFDQDPVGTPVKDRRISTAQEDDTACDMSDFSLPAFPSPCHGLSHVMVTSSPPPVFALTRPSNEYGEDERPYDHNPTSSPFEKILDIYPSPGRPLLIDQYDPEHPYLARTSPAVNPTRSFSSSFSAIPEESTAKFDPPIDRGPFTTSDSPPCSPKTLPSDSYQITQDDSAYRLPIMATTIPEEPLDTIDPAILSKDAFASLNSPFDNRSSSSVSKESPLPRPTSSTTPLPSTALSYMQPLIDAAFPPSHSPSPPLPSLTNPPSSPRPSHATLPIPTTTTPTLSFSTVPSLTPSGPRGVPPRSLRASIQTLRRMNSDTKKGGKAERRYANLGREDSIVLPGEESFLEDLSGWENGSAEEEEEEECETLDEDKARSLVGDLGFDWEEEEEEEGEEGVTDLDVPSTTRNLSSSPSTATATPKLHNDPANTTTTTTTSQLHPAQSSSPPSHPPPPPPPPRSSQDRSSSIWEDGEKFWASTPPPSRPPVTSPATKHGATRFLPLGSSPASSPTSRKRAFQVARDDDDDGEDGNDSGTPVTQDENRRFGEKRRDGEGGGRKRSVLGVGTPNVKRQGGLVGGGGVRGTGTPESLYDAEGFWRG